MGRRSSDTTPTVWRVLPEWSGEKLAREYNSGTPLRQLARQVGLSYGSVHRRLAEAGVTFRPRGGSRSSRSSG